MARWLPLWLLILALPAAAQDSGKADPAALEREQHWIKISAEAIRKTVLVEVRFNETTAGAGSGAIVSPDGLIATCAHVVEALGPGRLGSTEYTVVDSAGERHEAKLLGRSSNNDIAMLKIEAEGLAPFEIADDRRPARDAEVLAIGYPMGNLGTGGVQPGIRRDAIVHPSVMIGRVLNPSQRFFIPAQAGSKFYPDAIVTDTPVYMGNSGGPMVDASGRLVGLNAAIMPAAGKTFTLSVESIAKVFDTLADGRDAAGETPGGSSQEAGKTILEALGANFRGRPDDRPWLHAPFRSMARARSSGVVQLFRGDQAIGYATILDREGHAVTSLAVLENRSWGQMLLREIDKAADQNDMIKKMWRQIRELLNTEDSGGLSGRLASGRQVRVDMIRDSVDLGVALLRVEIPKDEKVRPIPHGAYASLTPGQWAVTVADGKPLAVGLLTHGHHSAKGIMTLPTSLGDLWKIMTRGGNRQVSFEDAILHDAQLEVTELGAPLLDSKGRLIGINLYHPARGTSYAVRLDNVLKEFRLGDGI